MGERGGGRERGIVSLLRKRGREERKREHMGVISSPL